MTESIESFVKKLQSEGLAAGEEAAEKIKNEARLEAGKILEEAGAEAKKILDQAEKEAKGKLLRGQTELELAVRDTLVNLRESIMRVLSELLTRRAEAALSDPTYLGAVIREVIMTYAKADSEQQARIEINLSKDMYAELNDTVFKDLFRELGDEQDRMGLKATLVGAGFEYKINGATIEVSPDSVSELISEMVSPALQEILDRVIGRKKTRIR